MGLLDKLIGTKEERAKRAAARAESKRQAELAREESRREFSKVVMSIAEKDPAFKEKLKDAVISGHLKSLDFPSLVDVATGATTTLKVRNSEVVVEMTRRIRNQATFMMFEFLDAPTFAQIALQKQPTVTVGSKTIPVDSRLAAVARAYAEECQRDGNPRLMEIIKYS
jgi:hypothetical protein